MLQRLTRSTLSPEWSLRFFSRLIDHENDRNTRMQPRVKTSSSPKPSVDSAIFRDSLSQKRAVHHVLTEDEAYLEAARCIKCADAPCKKACPVGVDIPHFMQCLTSKNPHGAAQVVLSDNPAGLSCGYMCSDRQLCARACVWAENPIKIAALERFAVERGTALGASQTRDPRVRPIKNRKIAIVGAGPAGLSCATYLGRLGYENITVFEKDSRVGGIPRNLIPEARLPKSAPMMEWGLLSSLVPSLHIQLKSEVDADKLATLQQEYDAVFVATGKGAPIAISAEFLMEAGRHHVLHARDFLRDIKDADEGKAHGPNVRGKRVVVLGAGPSGFDSAIQAVKHGAERVFIVFRRGIDTIDISLDLYEPFFHNRVHLIPFHEPRKICVEDDGFVSGIDLNSKLDPLAVIQVRCDIVIAAFGHGPGMNTLETALSRNVFIGGDAVGNSRERGRMANAVADGKMASAEIHALLTNTEHLLDAQEAKKIIYPLYHTAIDDVDISVEMAGVHFENPFGLASAPPATSGAMIKRAFEQGWAFAVTKTFSLDKDLVTNVSPRIATSKSQRNTFLNIELVSEKTMEYWLRVITELRRQFPEKRVVASVMAAYEKEDWQTLVRESVNAGADIVELNMSCPHGMSERGMGLACGQTESLVTEIVKWAKEVSGNVPVFPKLTPNITEIATIAQASFAGGADGVTAINTVAAMMDMDYEQPVIDGKTTYGGLSGSAVRPMALRAISRIAAMSPGAAIMGTGGMDSGFAAQQFMRAGASVMQISSALHGRDFSVLQDYRSGLRAEMHRLGFTNTKDLIGAVVPRIRMHGELPRTVQVHARVNRDVCIRCGKCMQTCNDCGYQAIHMDPISRKCVVDPLECTGCSLCAGGCPVHCITMVPRKEPVPPKRGVPPKGKILSTTI